MRVTSPTWRMMVSVQRSKVSRSSTITLPYLRRRRSAESCIGVSGFLISWAMRRATSAQAEVRCADDQLGDVVEGQHRAVVAPRPARLVRHAHREVALLAADDERDLVLRRGPCARSASRRAWPRTRARPRRARGRRARRSSRPSSFCAERLASVMRPWRSRPMTPADTPDSTASMKRRRSVSWLLAVTSSVRWRSSSLVMALKFIDRRRRSPSPRRIGSSTLRLPRADLLGGADQAADGRDEPAGEPQSRPRWRPAARSARS